jgi:Flp pilus assembly protein TadD/mono/diheme cytochrome c family protein
VAQFNIRIMTRSAAQIQSFILLGVFVSAISTLAQAPVKSAGAPAKDAPPTWSRQIAPILYNNCATCHHPGGAGPFSLLTYDDARRWSAQILTVTQSRFMPPWLPEPGYSDFADNRRLSTEDLEQIKRWVHAGMPEGIAAEAPTPPKYTSEWQLGPPDLILTAPKSFSIPADGQDLFRNFIYPVDITRTRYVRAVEILPGNARVVHHANILIDRTAELRRQHADDWRVGIPGMELEIGSGDRFDPDSHFLFWKPDTPAVVEPPGMPWRLDPGNDLILNTHLKPTGRVETVQPRIGLYFTDEAPTRAPMLLQLEHDAALNIPAGDSHFVIEDELRLPIAVYALGIYPHAHYLGKQLEAWSIAPDGKRTPLVLIKDWDIDRQSVYSYRKPLLLPAGSVLHMRYVYDNSAANPRNPASPPVRVHNGNRSTDEMGHLWLQVLPVHATERYSHGHDSAAAGRNGAADGKSNIDARMLLERAWMEHRLTRDPTDSLAAYNLASLDTMSGNPAGAIAIYRKLAAASPNDARVATSLGAAQEQTAGHNPEQTAGQNPAQTAGQNPEQTAGQNPAQNDDWQSALASYRHALTLDPNYADARYDLATLELKREQYAAAASDYRTLVQQQPDDAAAHGGLGAALAQLQQPDAARTEFDRALALDPSQSDTLLNYASLELTSSNPQHAQELLTRAVAAGAHDATTYQQLAFADQQTRHPAEAEAALRSAIAADPSDATSHSLLAQLLAARNDLAGAISEQQAALHINQRDADGWSNLGVLHAQSGQSTAARSDFEHALALDPQHAQARANLQRLNAGPSKP